MLPSGWQAFQLSCLVAISFWLFKSFLTSPISHLALFPLRFCLVFCPDFAHYIVYHSAVCPRLSRANTEPSLSHTCAFVPLWCISWHKTEASDQHALWTCLYIVPSEHREKAGPVWVERDKLHERTVSFDSDSCMVMEDLTVPLSVDL